MGVSGQHHAPAALYPRGKDPRTHCTGGWVGPRADFYKIMLYLKMQYSYKLWPCFRLKRFKISLSKYIRLDILHTML
jgi:hypothetical protein